RLEVGRDRRLVVRLRNAAEIVVRHDRRTEGEVPRARGRRCRRGLEHLGREISRIGGERERGHRQSRHKCLFHRQPLFFINGPFADPAPPPTPVRPRPPPRRLTTSKYSLNRVYSQVESISSCCFFKHLSYSRNERIRELPKSNTFGTQSAPP